jgi:large conductance mechanosensitive channel
MFQEFKKFVMRGNLLELAVAFILGIAFAAVVTAFTNIVLSLIAAAFGANTTFKRLTWVLNGTPIPYGAFLSAVVNFLLVAWVLFLLVKAYNRLTGPQDEPAATKSCEFCRTAILVDAVRCPNCTSDLMAPSASPPP